MASLDQIDHFVVLMLENRSFDNLLGWLYPGRLDFEGLTGSEVNPDGLGGSVKVWSDPKSAADMWLPKPDPGELFVDINEQLLGDGPVSGMPLASSHWSRKPPIRARSCHLFVMSSENCFRRIRLSI
jgi:phospholipase C